MKGSRKIDLRKLSGEEAQRIMKNFLSYDPKIGDFIWEVSTGPVKKGNIAGTPHGAGYTYIGVLGYMYMAHILAWLYMMGEWPGGEIDHKNHVRNDNRFENLREATREDQSKNTTLRSNSSSGVIGVNKCSKTGMWRARIYVSGKEKSLGRFKNKGDAIKARKNAEIEYGYHHNHGEKRKPLLKKNKVQKGFYRHGKTDKWVAFIFNKGEYKHLGLFKTQEEAIAARVKAEKEYAGL